MKKIKIISLICVTLLFSACSINVKVDELLSPPKLTQQQDAIYKALQNFVGKNIKLKYPRTGKYRSAFVLANIDDEPGDEALVFYELESSDGSSSLLRVNLLDQDEDENWFSAFDFAGFGSDVDEVVFSNLGTIGDTKIIIGYSALNQTQKSMCVLTYRNKRLTEIVSDTPYSYMEVLDLNLDGSEELILLNQDNATQTAKATLFKTNSSGVFYKVTETDAMENVSEYINISSGFAEKGQFGLFIDYSKSANQYGTDFIYYMGNRLINPIKETNQTLNTNRLSNNYNGVTVSMDIDDDGIIEIPASVPFPGYTTLSKQDQLNATIWYNLKNDKLTRKYYTYYSMKNKYIFIFPERWRDVVTAEINQELNEITFFEASEFQANFKYDGKRIKDPLLVIKTLDKTALGDDFYYTETELFEEGYIFISNNQNKNYYILLGNQEDNMKITKDDFISSFIVLDAE